MIISIDTYLLKLGADQYMEGEIMTQGQDFVLSNIVLPFYRVVLCKNTREKQTVMRAKTKITRKNK